MRFTNLNARAWRSLTVVAFVALLALTGAARVGHAATNGALTPTITVLNDNPDGSNGLILGQPTPGGNIGYRLNLNNQSTNTLNHIVISDTVPGTASVVFFSAPTGVSCSGQGTNTLTCTSSQLTAGAQFAVTVLFSTDPNGTPGTGVVQNVFSGTYAPQSQNTSNNRTDPTKTFNIAGPADRTYAGGGVGTFLAQSLLLPKDSHGQGQLHVDGSAGQSSDVTMPPGFLNSNNYVGTTLQNLIGTAGCTTCLTYQTNVVMPLAPTFFPGSPFWTGTVAQPFQVTIKIPGSAFDSKFKPSGVWHKDDSPGSLATQLPNCTYVNNVPQPQLALQGICVGSLVQAKGSKDIIAIEWALSNGSYWIG
jgi:uncharacterized repeat protein (TIGR01451 family)